LQKLSRSQLLTGDQRRELRDLQREGENLLRLSRSVQHPDFDAAMSGWLAAGDHHIVRASRWSVLAGTAALLLLFVIGGALWSLGLRHGMLPSLAPDILASEVSKIFSGQAAADPALKFTLTKVYWVAYAAAAIAIVALIFLSTLPRKSQMTAAILAGAIPIATIVGATYNMAHMANLVRSQDELARMAAERSEKGLRDLASAEADLARRVGDKNRIASEIQSAHDLDRVLNPKGRKVSFRDVAGAINSQMSVANESLKRLSDRRAPLESKLVLSCKKLYGGGARTSGDPAVCQAGAATDPASLQAQRDVAKSDERAARHKLGAEQLRRGSREAYLDLEGEHRHAAARLTDLARDVRVAEQEISAAEVMLAANQSERVAFERNRDRLSSLKAALDEVLSVSQGEDAREAEVLAVQLIADETSLLRQRIQELNLALEQTARAEGTGKARVVQIKAETDQSEQKSRNEDDKANNVRADFVNSWGMTPEMFVGALDYSGDASGNPRKMEVAARDAFFSFARLTASFVGDSELQMYFAVIFLVIFLPWLVQLVIGLPGRVQAGGAVIGLMLWLL
jgi:hypothetical protein